MHYAIGDVHGCFDELMNLIKKIENEDSNPIFIFLGDFPDRGPKVHETLEWMLANVTENGRYQSVRGNHEQSAIDWFYDEQRESYTDYAARVRSSYGCDDRKIREVIEFYQTMPLNKKIDIALTNGKVVPYRICHAAHRNGVSEEELKDINLWERDFWGKCDPDELTVCGHTPTIDRDFNLRGAREDMPGFICYRNKLINIDCGRCYPYENHGLTFLAGICLETLQEFYDADAEERVREYAASDAAEWERRLLEKLGMTDKESIIDMVFANDITSYTEKYGRCTESSYRKKIIEYFGFPEDTPYILERI